MKKKPTTKSILALTAAFALSAAAVQADKAVKALYITGGGWHDYDGQTKIITESLKASIPGIQITVAAVESNQNAPEKHTVFEEQNWADGYDVVIYNKCNSANTNNQELVERIVKPHYEGLPAVVIHCTMHCFRPDESGKWNAFLGIESRVFGTTIGHANETMLEDEFQTLLKNGVLWALGKDDE